FSRLRPSRAHHRLHKPDRRHAPSPVFCPHWRINRAQRHTPDRLPSQGHTHPHARHRRPRGPDRPRHHRRRPRRPLPHHNQTAHHQAPATLGRHRRRRPPRTA